jgi:hypothetical protein
MQTFPMICDQGHRFNFVGSYRDKPGRCTRVVAQHGLRCECNAPCFDDYGAKNIVVGAKRARGFENKKQSIMEFFPKRDAARMAEELGAVGKRCIQPDGTVVYEHRGDAAKFKAAKRAYEQRQRQRAAESAGRERAALQRGDTQPTEPVAGIPRGLAAAISERHAKMRKRDPRVIQKGRTKGTGK